MTKITALNQMDHATNVEPCKITRYVLKTRIAGRIYYLREALTWDRSFLEESVKLATKYQSKEWAENAIEREKNRNSLSELGYKIEECVIHVSRNHYISG
ncbi:MAG: hypothetical protein WC914_00070 [Proteiniphilum sp.]